MNDSSVVKVDSAFSPRGAMGQQYLASGVHVSMRLWTQEDKSTASGVAEAHSRRDYEVVGYVLGGRARLEIEGQSLDLKPGDSYLVPRGALHKYTILEPFSAVEATAPPAHVHARDESNLIATPSPASPPREDPGA